MVTGIGGWTQILARARERLLSAGDLGEGEGPRQEILDSWRRSFDDGANWSDVDVPYDERIDLSSKLVRAAEPVIGRVQEDVLGSPITVVLADSRGKVLIRRSGEPSLENQLDAAYLAPGFNYAEKYVGTNGIGTALEGRKPSLVKGFEHFNEQLQVFACVGVPLRDPITRRQLGVLDITTWADRANPALTALARQAATVIEEGLLQLSSNGARQLLQEYLVASRNREDRFLAISDEAFIGSSAVLRKLGGLGREELWPIVTEALSGRDSVELPLIAAGAGVVPLRMKAVRSDHGELAGALIEVLASPAGSTGLTPAAATLLGSVTIPRVPPTGGPSQQATNMPSLSGLSPVTIGPGVMVRRLAQAGLPVCLIGEPGVGKRTMAETVAGEIFPGRTVAVHDAAAEHDAGLVDDALAHWREGKPVLIRSAQALAQGEVTRLLTALSEPTSQAHGWLVFTLHSQSPASGAGGVEGELSASGVPMVVLPPLRNRVQDLHRILPTMLERASSGRVHSVSPALMNTLVREPWPGNLGEVYDLVLTMVRGSSAHVLDVGDLPPGFGSGVRRKLTPLEWMAREAIVDALRACNGDKAMAAEALGISRASIYRKIKTYNIDPSESLQPDVG
jgi:transcriptional regulator of acetoin/glycerol metabolism